MLKYLVLLTDNDAIFSGAMYVQVWCLLKVYIADVRVS